MNPIHRAAPHEYFDIEFWISRLRNAHIGREVMNRLPVPLVLKSPARRDTLRPHKVMPSYRVRETTC
jgi:hypothetical protein